MLMPNDQSGNSGNFANDREKASRAGQKGGENSGGNQN
jgi:general stress protein YciG